MTLTSLPTLQVIIWDENVWE